MPPSPAHVSARPISSSSEACERERANTSTSETLATTRIRVSWVWWRMWGDGGRFYWASRGPAGIVVVFAWLSSQERNLKPYVDLYSSLGWGSLICHVDFLTLWVFEGLFCVFCFSLVMNLLRVLWFSNLGFCRLIDVSSIGYNNGKHSAV